MSSSVLIVGAPSGWRDDLGADLAQTAGEAREKCHARGYACVAVFTSRQAPQDVLDLLSDLAAESLPASTVLVVDPSEKEWLARWMTKHPPVRVVLEKDQSELVTALQIASERHLARVQERDRLQLMDDQNRRLRQLNQELESRVEKRQKSLGRAKTKLLETNRQIEALHAANLVIQRARSIGELETHLAVALRAHLDVAATRIRFPSQSAISGTGAGAFAIPLSISGRSLGELQIVRGKPGGYSEEDLELLHQIGDAVALGVDRLAKLEEAEVLKQQWQATFDSISEPLCLTDAQYRIMRINRSFAEAAGKTYRELIGRNCFAEFFDAETAAEFQTLGRTFKVRRSRWDGHLSRSFEVTVQPLKFDSVDGEVVLVLCRDITSRLQMERQLLESTKMAELGLIGSSIAHELNNPLGGMLSFIQLIKMDLKAGDEFADDVREMESAAHRCRDIVQNLLGFARKGDSTDRKVSDLRETLTQALRITDLQTRSLGIEMNVTMPDVSLPLRAQTNQLSQAFCNLVQNAAEAVLEKRRADPRAEGRIDVALTATEQDYRLEIRDTGVGIAPEVQAKIFNPLFSTKGSNLNSGLGLTIAYRIISEHDGNLEISSQPGVGTTARIAFRRPDLSSTGQVFDPKI